MDFQKLQNHDPDEWRTVFNLLLGIGIAAASSFRSVLTPEEIEDAAIRAIEEADQQILKIQPLERSLKAWVYTAARYKAHELSRKKARKPEGHSDSFEQKLEASDESKVFGPPDLTSLTITEKAERTAKFVELLQQLNKDDFDLLWSLVVEDTPQKVVAEQHGWGEKSVGGRKHQAIARLAKLLRSDPNAAQLLKELELDHYIE